MPSLALPLPLSFNPFLRQQNSVTPMRLLLYTTALASLLLYTGCAGSAVDVNFRRRVDHVTYGCGITYSPPMNVTVGPYATVFYRNPDTAPLAVPLKQITGK